MQLLEVFLSVGISLTHCTVFMAKVNLNKTNQPLYEITSSGLTHSYEKILEKGEPNAHRVGDKLTGQRNFGVFHIDWSSSPPKVNVEVRGLEDELIFNEEIKSFQ